MKELKKENLNDKKFLENKQEKKEAEERAKIEEGIFIINLI